MAKKMTPKAAKASPKANPKLASKTAPKSAASKKPPAKAASAKAPVKTPVKPAVSAKPVVKTAGATKKPLAAPSAVKAAPKLPVGKTEKKQENKISKTAPASVKLPAQKDVKKAAGQKSSSVADAPVVKTKGAGTMSKTGAAAKAQSTTEKAPSAKAPAAQPVVELKVKAAGKTSRKAAGSSSKAYDTEICREIACEGLSTTAGYCRLHYIKNWKKIKRKEVILREKKLNQYIEELVSKYPDKYIEAIRADLADEKSFSKVIYDLELDEGIDDITGDEDADEAIIDSIKRDFDDGDTDF